MKNICVLCWLPLLLSCATNPGKTKPEKIDYIVQQAVDHKKFTGNVLVADKGNIIYRKSFGKADEEKGIDNTADTRFLTGSLSKPVTAMLILKLVDKGMLKPEDTIDKYFAITNPKVVKITVHQLLTHTSGLKELLTEEKNMNIAVQLQKATVNFEPGADFEYSNSAYVLLKEIAEKVTQNDFAALLREYVFLPAGMTNSGVAADSTLPTLAKGYKDASQSAVMSIWFPMKNINGAGSVYSTVDDLYKLDRALYTNKFLSEEMKALMLKQHVPGKYSYGWFMRERGGVWDVYWHRGSLPGFTAFISRRVEEDQFIVILTNTDDASLSEVEKDISRVLKDQ